MAEQFVKITDDEKIKTAEKYKIEGNELFKVKDLKKAMGKYHRAVLQLKGVGKETNVGALFGASGPGNVKLSEENQQKFDKLKVDCFNNLSACLLQEKDPNYHKVLEYCEEVLIVSPNNVKAHHRRGVALYHLRRYEDSMNALRSADEKDSSTKKYIHMCKTAIDKEDMDLRDTYRSMFHSKPSKDTGTSNPGVNGHLENLSLNSQGGGDGGMT